MEIIAQAKSIRVSTRKVRLVADEIRKMPVEKALAALMILDKRGSYSLEKTLRSAIANAVNNHKLSVNDLVIKSLEVNEATPLKRFHPSTRGRVHPFKKRGSHIRFVLEAKDVEVKPSAKLAVSKPALKAKGKEKNGK